MKQVFFLLFIITSLVTIWFYRGMVIAAGESGVPFSNYENLLERTRYAWSEALIGSSSNQQGIIFISAVAILGRVGVPDFLIQTIFYWLVLSTAGIGVYLLSLYVSNNKSSSLLSAMFYLLNLFTMVTVINRLQYAFMFFYACLPVTLLIFIIGIDRKKIVFSLLFALSSLPFSIALASFPFLEIWWGLMLSYLLYWVYTGHFSTQRIIFAIRYFLTALIGWLLINAWWFIPLLISTFSTSYATTEAVTQSGNINALISLSRLVGGLPYVFALSDLSFFKSLNGQWGILYSSSLLRTLFIIPTLLVIAGAWSKHRFVAWNFFFLLFILCIFFAKGSTSPLGEVSVFLVSSFRFLEVFRNSFEKIGFLLNLVMALLVGPSILHFVGRSKIKLLILSVLLFVVFVHPMWTGMVFSTSSYPSSNPDIKDYVLIPDYYKQVDNLLVSKSDSYRTAVFPISGEGITYSWKYGYNGVELSSELLTTPVISFNTSVPFLSDIIYSLEDGLSNKPDKLKKFLKSLGIKFFLVRDDIINTHRQIRDPKEITSLVKNISGISHEETIGKLDIYSITTDDVSPFIFTSSDLIESQPRDRFTDLALDINKKGIIVGPKNDKFLPATQILVKPQKDYVLPYDQEFDLDMALSSMQTIKHLPGSFLYTFVLIKEEVQRLGLPTSGSAVDFHDLSMLDKRLLEIYKLSESDSSQISKSISLYQKLLDTRLFHPGSRLTRQISINQLSVFFNRHLKILDISIERSDSFKNKLQNLKNNLLIALYSSGLDSYYSPINKQQDSRIIRFNVIDSGTYILKLDSFKIYDFFTLPDRKVHYQLDTKSYKSTTIDTSDNSTSLGQHYLEAGIHEVIISPPSAKNLIKISNSELQISSTDFNYVWPVLNFISNSNYLFQMDYLVERGDGFELRFIQNVDLITEDDSRSFHKQSIKKDKYDHGWQHFETTLSSYRSASAGRVELIVKPYNFCTSTRISFLDRCNNDDYRAIFNKLSLSRVKNLRVTKVFDNAVYLVKDNNIQPRKSPQVIFKKINPSHYSISVRESEVPYVLVMNQLYDQNWKLKPFVSGIKFSRLIINGFANGWLIQPNAGFSADLYFYPQTILERSRMVSIVVFFSMIIMFIVKLWKKE